MCQFRVSHLDLCFRKLVIQARENARLGEIYEARAQAVEREQLRAWTERVASSASASAASASASARKFDRTIAKIKQALDEAKDDQGSAVLAEAEVKVGRLDKGDFRLYKAMVNAGARSSIVDSVAARSMCVWKKYRAS